MAGCEQRDQRSWGPWPALGLALLIGLAGFVSLPAVDRDEARFAQTSRQMLESLTLPDDRRDPRLHSGGAVVPMLADQPRLNKPPLIYWLQAASAGLCTLGDPARDAVWMYRLPSLIAGVAVVLVAFGIGRSMFDAPTGSLAATLLAVAPLLAWEMHQARADMVLLLWTTLAQRGLWEVWKAHHRRAPPAWVATLWASLALGILTKGPITPMIAGLTAAGLCVLARDVRWLAGVRPLPGLALCLLIVAPWVYLAGAAVGWETLVETAGREVLGRSAEPREGHWGPPGYHAVAMVALFWPGSMAVGLGLACAWNRALTRSKSDRERPVGDDADAGAFLLAWLIPSWLVFEGIMTKLPHYTMPLYPALAVLCARALRFPTPSRRWVRVGLIASGAVGALWLLGPQAALLGWTDARHHLGAPGLLALAGCLGLGCLGLAGMARSIAGMHAGRAVACGVIVAACAEVGLLGVTLPASDSLWVTRSLGRVLAPYLDRAIAAAGYHEDSLVLLTRGRVERIAVEEIPEWIRTHPGGLVVVPAGVLSHTGTVQRVGAVAGVNYSRGRRVSLEVFLVDGGGG